jgi:DNA-binding SARP family transcriptional activator
VEFAILGPLEVRDQHRRIEVPGGNARRVLAVLVMHINQIVSTDRLIEALWNLTPPVTAANTLQTYVSHLRRALEPDRSPRAKDGVLRTHSNGYQLVVASEAVDAVRFERLVDDGRRALASDPAQAAESLRAALGLWRGDPLAEFGWELFAQAEITRLTELRAAAVEDRIEADLALGRHAELCSELSRAVVEQPLRERLWSQLIRALYRCGRQADAVAAYARLREQLGIEPSRELVRLHEAVLAQRPELDWTPPPQSSGEPSMLAELPNAEELLPAARTALAAHDWRCVFDLLSRADQAAPLSAEDFAGLAEAAWWLGRYREGLAARQRAHQAHLQAGDSRRAAFDAAILTMQYAAFQQFAPANGWFQRAQRLLEEEPDCAEYGYLSLATTFVTLGIGDHQRCLVAAQSTYDVGLRHGVAELRALGMMFQGTVLTYRGCLAEGLALHEEGVTLAASGSLAQLATMEIFCQVVSTSGELGELPGRARLELLCGRPTEAAALINAALTGEGKDPMRRAQLLPDQVAVALAAGDLDTARVAATELGELAQIYGSAALLAAAEVARGALVLATGEDNPLPSLRRSGKLWQQAELPRESARARLLLATACFDRRDARLNAEAIAEPAAMC